jgi:hypothetical protein
MNKFLSGNTLKTNKFLSHEYPQKRNLFSRLIGDTFLVGILLAMLFLPFGAVVLSGVGDTNVLSETDVYENAESLPNGGNRGTPQVYQNQKLYPFEQPGYFESALETSATAPTEEVNITE